jgi:hypothetical protein
VGQRPSRCVSRPKDTASAQGDDAPAQAEVDRWDGANLRLLGAIVRAFAHGNKALASVPRLRVVVLLDAWMRALVTAATVEVAIGA